jgi:hypothetical protein
MQYTLRNIPKQLDRVLRSKAKAEGKSLNKALLDAVKRGLGLGESNHPKRDLSFLGKLSDAEAKAIDEAHEFCDRAEIDRWRSA